jgi:hypothetical protein
MKRIFASAALVMAVSASAAAQSGASLVPATVWATLAREGSAFASGFETGRPLALLPAHPLAPALRRKVAADGANVTVELLFAYARPAPADRDAELLSLYNLMRSVSTLEGIQYWSESRKAMRTLYAKSYRIDDASRRNRLPDSLVKAVPARDSFLVLQEDLTFGVNVYEYAYEADRTGILVESVNVTGLWYGILPAVGERSLKVRTLLMPCDDCVLAYIVSTANASIIPGVQGKIEDSFSNRARAVYEWFRKGADRIYRKS